MNLLSDASVCDTVDNGTVCTITWNVTHNDRVALASDWLIGKPLAIAGLILIALIARWLLHRLIDRLTDSAAEGVLPSHITRRRLGRSKKEADVAGAPTVARRAQRAKAMGSLLKNTVTAVIFAMVTIMAISELGYEIAPLIASAGILGLALGFGAQSLVGDYLAGIFMIFEDQYGVSAAKPML